MAEMKRSRFNRRDRLVIVFIIFALLPVYWGAYSAMVKPRADFLKTPPGALKQLGPAFPHYSQNQTTNAALQVFFGPAYQIDRRLRQDKWDSSMWPPMSLRPNNTTSLPK